MNYFITGGAGFIGSHLAEKLLSNGEIVSIIDDLSTGSIDNIEHLKSNVNFEYKIDSIMNEHLLAELIDKADVVFHLAAAVGVKLIVESPVRTIETNIQGTELVLKMASKKKKKIIIASTSEVYGKGNCMPFKETGDLVFGPTTKGRWSYACSKAIDEFLGLAYHKEKKVPVIIVRLFNTVGPRQTGMYGMVVPTFVKQALLNHPITVYGDGQQTRCFTFVGDVVDALVKLTCNPKAVGEIFNIGSTEEISIKELAELVKSMTKSNSEIVYIPYDKAYEEGFEDMQKRIPDLSKIREFIGYKPTTNLKGILEKVIDWAKG
jgi:UDP-glucose 4-epimerase